MPAEADRKGSVCNPAQSFLAGTQQNRLGTSIVCSLLWSTPHEHWMMFSINGKIGQCDHTAPVLYLEACAAITNVSLPDPGHHVSLGTASQHSFCSPTNAQGWPSSTVKTQLQGAQRAQGQVREGLCIDGILGLVCFTNSHLSFARFSLQEGLKFDTQQKMFVCIPLCKEQPEEMLLQ